MLLSGDDEVLNKLRKQYEVAKIASREFSDAGFYTSFLVENRNDLCIKNKSFHIGDVDVILMESKVQSVLCSMSKMDILHCWKVTQMQLIHA